MEYDLGALEIKKVAKMPSHQALQCLLLENLLPKEVSGELTTWEAEERVDVWGKPADLLLTQEARLGRLCRS